MEAAKTSGSGSTSPPQPVRNGWARIRNSTGRRSARWDEADDWRVQRSTHICDGFCERCNEPEIDELEAVECDYCRAIFEHTGRMHCPIHQDAQDLAPLLNEPETNLPAMLEAPKKQTPINLILRAKEIQAAQGITFGEALTEAQLRA